VIVGNNDPSENLPKGFRLPANVSVIDVSEKGSYAVRNAALEHAKGQSLAFTDADCVPTTDWLAHAVKFMTDNKDVAIIAGAIEIFSKGDVPNVWEAYDAMFLLQQDAYALRGQAATANVITRQSVFDEVGPFDSSLMSGGDTEWTKRVTMKGLILVYGRNIIVRHPARDEFGAIIKKARRLAGGMVAKKRSAGQIFVLPQLDRLIPSVSGAKRIYRSKRFGFIRGFSVWLVHYLYSLTILIEQIRLAWPRGQYQR